MTDKKFDKPILTMEEVSELLRVHTSTVSRYAKTGQLKSHLIGSRRLFEIEDVWLFFENQVAPEYVSGNKED